MITAEGTATGNAIAFRCDICGSVSRLTLPMNITVLLQLLGDFIGKHEHRSGVAENPTKRRRTDL